MICSAAHINLRLDKPTSACRESICLDTFSITAAVVTADNETKSQGKALSQNFLELAMQQALP
jgi:hypothetical protein